MEFVDLLFLTVNYKITCYFSFPKTKSILKNIIIIIIFIVFIFLYEGNFV